MSSATGLGPSYVAHRECAHASTDVRPSHYFHPVPDTTRTSVTGDSRVYFTIHVYHLAGTHVKAQWQRDKPGSICLHLPFCSESLNILTKKGTHSCFSKEQRSTILIDKLVDFRDSQPSHQSPQANTPGVLGVKSWFVSTVQHRNLLNMRHGIRD